MLSGQLSILLLVESNFVGWIDVWDEKRISPYNFQVPIGMLNPQYFEVIPCVVKRGVEVEHGPFALVATISWGPSQLSFELDLSLHLVMRSVSLMPETMKVEFTLRTQQIDRGFTRMWKPQRSYQEGLNLECN